MIDISYKFVIVAYYREFSNTRTATGMDGTVTHCIFENLKPVEVSKNCFNII